MRRQLVQTSPSDNGKIFKFWSDNNLAVFKRELDDLNVRYEQTDHGVLFVFDDSRDIERIGRDLGADHF